MTILSTLADIAIAVGPSLAYADQLFSIIRRKDSGGFSTDICGVLIVANTTRCFYWLGARFGVNLLIQSLLMLVSQFGLLYVCLKYAPGVKNLGAGESDEEARQGLLAGGGFEPKAPHRRPLNLWQWTSFGTYLESIAILIVFHCLTFLIFHRFATYVSLLGFLALGIEATLPIPQLATNFRRKSTFGFRPSVLAAWVLGDAAKTTYFFIDQNNSVQFKACSLFQLSVDLLLLAQTYFYRQKTREDEARAREEGIDGVDGVAGAAAVLPPLR